MPLSDTAFRKLKPRDRDYKVSDGAGLYLLVRPNGSKLWRLAYRFEGKQKTLAFGAYPSVTLARARERRDEVKAVLADGRDPGAQVAQDSDTFEALAKEWYRGRVSEWSTPHAARVWSAIERDMLPVFGRSPVRAIEPLKVLEAVRQVEQRGARETAHRTKQYAGMIFRYGVATGKCDRDPTADLRGALAPAPRPQHYRTVKAGDLSDFFQKLAHFEGDAQTALGLELIMHTMVRTSELRLAQWSEFDLGRERIWRIPAERMKKKREHMVPLTDPVLEILNKLKFMSVRNGFVLEGKTRGPVSQNTLLFALYRLGYHGRATVHGFRGLASTVLNESGNFESDWIEKQLAHEEGNRVRAAYNSAQWLPQRRAMMAWWSDYLQTQKEIGEMLG